MGRGLHCGLVGEVLVPEPKSWARTPLWENADYAIFSGAQEPYIVVFERCFDPCGDGYWDIAKAKGVPLAIRALIDERNADHYIAYKKLWVDWSDPDIADMQPCVCVSRCCE